ncbi:hypothetical protein BDV37DRAFT_279718 [Aspergillus pseudonomiae]|uniref:Uncharacterized protein n=1 Tax=Aspergillus pseudonomiae TaxID=1506151 RepID=A0A5N7DQ03_9EURO|nr:uncharacterized protein BDV37DRAFT_279718 [Aspergillus pseudonomiae]KAE8407548.1 hypothetical protein BDV37DRAFT_279718 [Aspergillus pseudonomiae]
MAESPASIMKLSLPLANEDLGRLIRRIEQHCPSENTLTVTFSQEHKASQVHVNDGAITKPIAKTRRVKKSSTVKQEILPENNNKEAHKHPKKSSVQALGMINVANLTEQETADLIMIMCPADFAGVKCNQTDCKFLRRCESMQEHESISCAMVRCTYIHGLKVSCPKILTDRGCVTLFLSRLSPSYCQFGHDHRAARLFNYKEGSACHGVLNLETKKKRRLAGPGPAGFGLVPRAGAI